MQEQKIEFYYHWDKLELLENAFEWNKDMRKRMRTATEYSTWWTFVWYWELCIVNWIRDFRTGFHKFAPMIQCKFQDEVIKIWDQRLNMLYHRHVCI